MGMSVDTKFLITVCLFCISLRSISGDNGTAAISTTSTTEGSTQTSLNTSNTPSDHSVTSSTMPAATVSTSIDASHESFSNISYNETAPSASPVTPHFHGDVITTPSVTSVTAVVSSQTTSALTNSSLAITSGIVVEAEVVIDEHNVSTDGLPVTPVTHSSSTHLSATATFDTTTTIIAAHTQGETPPQNLTRATSIFITTTITNTTPPSTTHVPVPSSSPVPLNITVSSTASSPSSSVPPSTSRFIPDVHTEHQTTIDDTDDVETTLPNEDIEKISRTVDTTEAFYNISSSIISTIPVFSTSPSSPTVSTSQAQTQSSHNVTHSEVSQTSPSYAPTVAPKFEASTNGSSTISLPTTTLEKIEVTTATYMEETSSFSPDYNYTQQPLDSFTNPDNPKELKEYWSSKDVAIVIGIMFLMNIISLIFAVTCVYCITNRNHRWDRPPMRCGSRNRHTPRQVEYIGTLSGGQHMATDEDCKSGEKMVEAVPVITKDSGWCVPFSDNQTNTEDTGV